ncbi:MAG: tyrosine-type recombinase/integrase [Chloroflexota bacterium]|nr:tyrosine-type recombinase/integrase [Chloroflexota bacterium]
MTKGQTSLHLDAANCAVSALSDDAAANGWLLHLRAAGRRGTTERAYRQALDYLRRFTQARGMPPLAALTTEHLREYFLSLYKRGLKPTSVSVWYRAIQQFYKWLVAEGERPDNPITRIPAPRVADEILPHYSPEEVQRVLDSVGVRNRDWGALRDRAVILFLFDTGVRARELCDMRMEDLDLHNLSILVHGKAGKQRQVGIGYASATAIERYHRRRKVASRWVFSDQHGGQMTFNGVKMALGRRFKAAGVLFRGCHAFRRAFAIAWLDAGGGPEDLARLAGWDSPQMLRRYTRATEGTRALAAHRRFSPGDQLQTKRA